MVACGKLVIPHLLVGFVAMWQLVALENMRWFGSEKLGTAPYRLLNIAKCCATAVLIGSCSGENSVSASPCAPFSYEYSSPCGPYG